MGEKPLVAFVVVVEVALGMLATWVPAKAKKRNIVVPTNSPIMATKSVVWRLARCHIWRTVLSIESH